MGKKVKLGILILVVVLLSCIGYQLWTKMLPNEKAYLASDRDEQWRKDIDYLEATLPKVHKNLYFKKSEADFKGELEAIKEKVPDYTDEEINIAMALVVASMGDTHTNLSIGVDKIYPIALYWYDEGFYITDVSEEYKDLLYSKVISLNDKPMEEVANHFKPFFTGGNEQWFKNQVIYYITSNELLKYFGIIKEDEIRLKIEKPNGNVEEVKMSPQTSETFQYIEDKSLYNLPLYKTHPYENYWYEYLPEEKIMYVSYNSASEMLDLPFTIFTDEVFKTIENQEVDKLIIDIRNNQGGSDRVFKPFLKKLKKSKLNEEGKLYVVMGRKTYSAGLNTVISLKKSTHAILVGEASGGEPNHYGDTRSFKLPNSQIHVSYSTEYFKKVDQDIKSLEPDVMIGVSGEMEKVGRDSVLEWINAQ